MLWSQGKFIQTMQFGGHRYGLSRDAIEDVAREGLACCVHMEMEVRARVGQNLLNTN